MDYRIISDREEKDSTEIFITNPLSYIPNKIDRIKLLRKATGMGLKDSKEAIEGIKFLVATPKSDTVRAINSFGDAYFLGHTARGIELEGKIKESLKTMAAALADLTAEL